MTLRYFIPLLLLCSLTVSTAYGQFVQNLDRVMLIKISDRGLYGDPSKERPVGSPYLQETFVKGTIIVKKVSFKDVPMRYNVYDDVIEFKKAEGNFIFDPQREIEKVVLDGHTFVVDSYEVKGKSKLGFFIRLDSGKVSVLMKKNVYFRDQQAPKALESGPTPPTFTKGPDVFYFAIGSGTPVKVESIKKMIAAFPDKQAELTTFAKQEKISKDEEGLVKLGKYLNSIMGNP